MLLTGLRGVGKTVLLNEVDRMQKSAMQADRRTETYFTSIRI